MVLRIIIFQPIYKYLKLAHINDISYVLSWKSKGISDIKIESIITKNYLLNPRINLYNMCKIRIEFTGSFLNKFPPAILHRNIISSYIAYEITSNYSDMNYATKIAYLDLLN